MNSAGALSVYIHVPYCASKCHYCDFISYVHSEDTVCAYFAALAEEIRANAAHGDTRRIDTVYIGGGTPSFVHEKYIADTLGVLREVFSLSENCEISMEANPNSLTYDKCLAYKQAGINRISIGAQAVQDAVLARIGRIHTFADIQNAVQCVQRAGISNFNLDLMAALPEQTLEDFKQSLIWCAQSGAKHISAYSLTLAEGTQMYLSYARGEYAENDVLEREMYYAARETLEKYGFYRYEISNYAKRGFECRHNLNCWNYFDYLGFGAAACSFYGGVRYQNEADISEYINRINRREYLPPEELTERNNVRTLEGEYMMLGLRKSTGADIKGFNERFGEELSAVFGKQTAALEKEGLLRVQNGKITLTDKGLDFANSVMCEFLD